MSIRLDAKTFDACFESWLALKHFKRRDWPEIGPIYREHLDCFRPVELSEALSRLVGKQDEFPTIHQVKSELAKNSSAKVEESASGSVSPELFTLGIRAMERHFGKPSCSPHPPNWLSEYVRRAVKTGESEAQRQLDRSEITRNQFSNTAERYALGALNVLLCQHKIDQ